MLLDATGLQREVRVCQAPRMRGSVAACFPSALLCLHTGCLLKRTPGDKTLFSDKTSAENVSHPGCAQKRIHISVVAIGPVQGNCFLTALCCTAWQ